LDSSVDISTLSFTKELVLERALFLANIFTYDFMLFSVSFELFFPLVVDIKEYFL